MLTQERLKELLNYDPATGIFTRRTHVSGKFYPGDVAGSDDGRGYIQISIDNIDYRAHRLAWLYMTGEFPFHEVDHENGNHADTRWKNLRPATRLFNSQNRKRANKNNAIGLLGVSAHNSKFRATISNGGIKTRLGMFDTPEQAHAAYIEAKRQLHEGCTI